MACIVEGSDNDNYSREVKLTAEFIFGMVMVTQKSGLPELEYLNELKLQFPSITNQQLNWFADNILFKIGFCKETILDEFFHISNETLDDVIEMFCQKVETRKSLKTPTVFQRGILECLETIAHLRYGHLWFYGKPEWLVDMHSLNSVKRVNSTNNPSNKP